MSIKQTVLIIALTTSALTSTAMAQEPVLLGHFYYHVTHPANPPTDAVWKDCLVWAVGSATNNRCTLFDGHGVVTSSIEVTIPISPPDSAGHTRYKRSWGHLGNGIDTGYLVFYAQEFLYPDLDGEGCIDLPAYSNYGQAFLPQSARFDEVRLNASGCGLIVQAISEDEYHSAWAIIAPGHQAPVQPF